MFTGIITALGAVAELGELRCRFSCPSGWLATSALGDSIAVNGVCLTVTAIADDSFACDISAETRRCCAPLAAGGRVNLEQALALGDKLGGHIVTGHIDGVAQVAAAQRDDSGGILMRVKPPPALAPLIATKGSVALAGVSLTVNRVGEEPLFEVYLVPHTVAHTTLADYSAGHEINLETDILARHVARLLQTRDGGTAV